MDVKNDIVFSVISYMNNHDWCMITERSPTIIRIDVNSNRHSRDSGSVGVYFDFETISNNHSRVFNIMT